MEKQIYAAEPEFIVSYLTKIENATSEHMEAAANAMFGEIPSILDMRENEAVISINGILSKNGPPMIARFFGFGGTSYTDIIDSIKIAESDPAIDTIRLKMDTPGGGVDGVDAVFQALCGVRKKKKVIAENHGLMASAGYWIASAADEIVALDPTVLTGSIGVAIVGYDESKQDERDGIKRIKILSRNAPNKQAGFDTKKERDVLQKRVDAVERIFINRIAQGRGISEETVRENFGQGGLMVAQDPDQEKDDALSAGMIDRIEENGKIQQREYKEDDKDDNDNMEGIAMEAESTLTPASADFNINMEDVMDLTTLMAEHPALKAQVEARDNDNYTRGVESGRAEVNTRIEKATTFLNSDYPKAIQNLAIKVLDGSTEPAALEGAVTAFDAMAEQNSSTTAQEETAGLQETPGEQQAATTEDGAIATEADFMAEVNRTITEVQGREV